MFFRKRGCTDVICLLLFLAFLGGWIFVAYFSYMQGDIAKVREDDYKYSQPSLNHRRRRSPQVIYPTDSRGRICGNGDLKDRPHLLFFDLTRCLNPAVLALGCQTPQVRMSFCNLQQERKYKSSYTTVVHTMCANFLFFCQRKYP